MHKILLVIDEYKELVALENLLRRLGFDVLSVGKDILVNDALVRFVPEIVIATLKGRAVDGIKVSMRVRRQTPSPLVAFLTAADNATNLSQEQKLYMDALILLPLQPQTVIRTIAQMAQLDPGPLIGKFQKMTSNRIPDGRPADRGGESKASESEPAESRFVRGSGTEPNDSKLVSSKEPEPSENPWEMELAEAVRAETENWDPVKTRGQAAIMRTQRSDHYEQFLRTHDEPVEGVLQKEKLMQAARELKRAIASAGETEDLKRLDVEKREFVRSLFVESAETEAEQAKGKKAGPSGS